MSFATIEARLDAATTQAEVAAQLLEDVVTGPESGPGSIVEVDTGVFVKSVAKAVADIEVNYVGELGAHQLSLYGTLVMDSADEGDNDYIINDDNSSLPESEEWRFSTIIFTDVGTVLSGDKDIIYPDDKVGPAARFINATTRTLRLVTEDPSTPGTANPADPGIFLRPGESEIAKNYWPSLGTGMEVEGLAVPPKQGSIASGVFDRLTWEKQSLADGSWQWVPKAVVRSMDDFINFCEENTIVGGPYDGDTLYKCYGMVYEFKKAEIDASGGLNFGAGTHVEMSAYGGATTFRSDIPLTNFLIIDTLSIDNGIGEGGFVEGLSIVTVNGIKIIESTFVMRDAALQVGTGNEVSINSGLWFQDAAVIANGGIGSGLKLSSDGTVAPGTGNLWLRVENTQATGNPGLFQSNSELFDVTGVHPDDYDVFYITLDGVDVSGMPAGTSFVKMSGPEQVTLGKVLGCAQGEDCDPTFTFIENVDSKANNWIWSDNIGMDNTNVNGFLVADHTGAPLTTAHTGTTPQKVNVNTVLNDGATGFTSLPGIDNLLVYTRYVDTLKGQFSVSMDADADGAGNPDPFRMVMYKNGVPYEDPVGYVAQKLFASDNYAVVASISGPVRAAATRVKPTTVTIGSPTVSCIGQNMTEIAVGQAIDTNFSSDFIAGTRVLSFSTTPGAESITFDTNAVSDTGDDIIVGDSFETYTVSVDGGDDYDCENFSMGVIQ